MAELGDDERREYRWADRITRRSREGSKSTADYMDEEHAAGVRKGVALGRQTERNQGRANREPRSFTSPVSLQAPTAGPVPGVTVPMVLEVILVSADSLINEHRPPLPSRLLAIFGVFGVLGLARGTAAARAASAMAWALVIATLYSAAVPGTQPGGIRALSAIGDFMNGKYGQRGPSAGSTASNTTPPWASTKTPRGTLPPAGPQGPPPPVPGASGTGGGGPRKWR